MIHPIVMNADYNISIDRHPQIDTPINDLLCQPMTRSTNSGVLKDLKDIIDLGNSTEEILKDVNYMVSFLYTKIRPKVRSNQKGSPNAQ